MLLVLLWFNPERDSVSTLPLVSNVAPPADLIAKCLGSESTRSWFQLRFESNFIIISFNDNHKFINFNNSKFEGCVKYILSRAALVSETILELYNPCFLLCQLFSTAHWKMWNHSANWWMLVFIVTFIVIYVYREGNLHAFTIFLSKLRIFLSLFSESKEWIDQKKMLIFFQISLTSCILLFM